MVCLGRQKIKARQRISFVLLVSLALPVASDSAHAAHFDPPDLKYEFELYRHYLKLEEPALIERKNGVIENYRLQPGENLWTLSQMLYGDGSYWPKIWAQNPSITNPHLIRPGYVLQFWTGSEDDAPAFRFSETSDESMGGSGLELTAANESESSDSPVEIPEPEAPPRPVLKLPKSFPQWQQVYHRTEDLKLDDSHIALDRQQIAGSIPLMAYVQDEPLVSSGSFLEMEKESGLPDARQYAYVKLKKGQGHIGQKYLMVKDHGEIPTLTQQIRGDISARFIEIYGDLELSDTADPSVNDNDDGRSDYFRAVIVHSIGLAQPDAQLIPGQVQFVDLKKGGPLGTVNAQLIGAAKSSSSDLYGPGEIVFLNKGSDNGVQVDQVFKVHIDRLVRDQSSSVNFSKIPSGSIRIVRVAKSCSTAIVLEATDSLRQGDRTQPRMASDSETSHREGEAAASGSAENSGNTDGSNSSGTSGDEIQQPDSSSDL